MENLLLKIARQQLREIYEQIESMKVERLENNDQPIEDMQGKD